MFKHPTVSVFVFRRTGDGWRLGLLRAPRSTEWLLPTGQVEPHENPAETAARLVSEATGLTGRVLGAREDRPWSALSPGDVPLPMCLTEQRASAGACHPDIHLHIDHLYAAVARPPRRAGTALLSLVWFTDDEIDDLDLFFGSRTAARLLFDRLTTAGSALTGSRLAGSALAGPRRRLHRRT